VVIKKRKKSLSLVLTLDKLPTLYLPALFQWLNENRADGLVTLLGFQNMAQLEKTYGKELARAILEGHATKAVAVASNGNTLSKSFVKNDRQENNHHSGDLKERYIEAETRYPKANDS
jgi:type IV secretory pathway TraG/TraD family ATPase VirD4